MTIDTRLTMHPVGSAEWLLILLAAVVEIDQSLEKLERRLDRLEGRVDARDV